MKRRILNYINLKISLSYFKYILRKPKIAYRLESGDLLILDKDHHQCLGCQNCQIL